MKKITKIVIGLVITGTILSAGVVAMADTNDKTINGICDHIFMKFKGIKDPSFNKDDMRAKMQEDFKLLVDNSIITQDESDKLSDFAVKLAEEKQALMEQFKASMESGEKPSFDEFKKMPFDKGNSIFDEAVSEGIITQEKADAIKAFLTTHFQEAMKTEMKDRTTEQLNVLIQDGTINQDQLDKIVNALSDRKQIKSLLDDGTLTEEQYNAVSNALHMRNDMKDCGPRNFDMKDRQDFKGDMKNRMNQMPNTTVNTL